MEQIINNLRLGLQQTWLSGDILEDTLAQTMESIERLAFGRLLSEYLSEDERYIYQELLEMDGEVNGYDFLKSIRPDNADEIIQRLFQEEVDKFLHTL